ncbi:hypothetical protein EG68_05310 [Paragonimus skrjabini miyazakii]|uniref:Uncharacterized protein n=1 Tax=Paragonimus skrjabini miyazakii TaxID=59628 RepID=A0A8S9Z3M0_9TREM|nr:hypothetical protein EG68_05310 [Paragonimus skrjabini miyazakii]
MVYQTKSLTVCEFSVRIPSLANNRTSEQSTGDSDFINFTITNQVSFRSLLETCSNLRCHMFCSIIQTEQVRLRNRIIRSTSFVSRSRHYIALTEFVLEQRKAL